MDFCPTLRGGLFSWELTLGPHRCWRYIQCRMVRNSAADWLCSPLPCCNPRARITESFASIKYWAREINFRALLDRRWSNDGAEPQHSRARFPGPKRKPRSVHHAKLAAFLLLRSTE